jgi:hypothetical protein
MIVLPSNFHKVIATKLLSLWKLLVMIQREQSAALKLNKVQRMLKIHKVLNIHSKLVYVFKVRVKMGLNRINCLKLNSNNNVKMHAMLHKHVVLTR